MSQTRKDPPPSDDVADALTQRPLPPTDRAPTIEPGRGGTGPASEADVDTTDESLRPLPPKSPRRHFGEDPNIRPEGDPHEGAKDWVEHSPGMRKNFPDDGKS